jgi:uncharacterized membrane protein YhfC
MSQQNHHRSASMELCYSDFRRFDDKLDLILAGVTKTGALEAIIVGLTAEIKQLIDEAAIDQAAKDALNTKIAAALARSQVAEDRLRSAIPK